MAGVAACSRSCFLALVADARVISVSVSFLPSSLRTDEESLLESGQ